MNEIADLLLPEAVIPHLRAVNKRHVLQELAALTARLSGGDERMILDAVMDRETLGSTGIGRGIATPHGKVASAQRLIGAFAHLETKIDFGSIDDEPVDLVFLLIAPESAGADNLKALARVSRLFRNEELCRKLRGAKTADALYATLTGSTTRSA